MAITIKGKLEVISRGAKSLDSAANGLKEAADKFLGFESLSKREQGGRVDSINAGLEAASGNLKVVADALRASHKLHLKTFRILKKLKVDLKDEEDE